MAKKKSNKGMFIVLGIIIGLPVLVFIGWYVLTVVLQVTGSDQSAKDMMINQLSKAKQGMFNELKQRAKTEGFSLWDVDSCTDMDEQYTMPMGKAITPEVARELIGIPASADDEAFKERCVAYAKAVTRMQRLLRHDKHAMVCNRAHFSTGEGSRYILRPDSKGRGVLESSAGKKALITIHRNAHVLVKDKHVYNMGGGCIIIGLSGEGVFAM